MKALVIAILLVLSAATLPAQTSGAASSVPYTSELGFNNANSTRVLKRDLGFSYSYPSGWDDLTHTKFFEALNRMNELRSPKGKESSGKDLMSRAIQCRQMVLMLARPKPLSATLIVSAIPFDCIGRPVSQSDFPVFAATVTQNVSGIAKLRDVEVGTYTLGSHSMGIERGQAVSALRPQNGQSERSLVEISCSMLTKAFVCWIAVASNEAVMKEFEQSAVTLDGESEPALVPASAIAQLKTWVPPKRAIGSTAAPTPQSGAGPQSPSPAQESPNSARKESNPASGSTLGVFTSDLGFSYTYPSSWEVLDTKPTQPAQKPTENPKTDTVSRKAECTQTLLTLRYSNPRPVVVVVIATPFDCTGDTMSESDLSNVVTGGLWAMNEKDYELKDEVFGNYALGSHRMRIGRAKLLGKGHPEQSKTKELVCSLLKKAWVCWLAVADDETALKLFEQNAVTLDGEPAPALTPAPAEAFATPSVFKSDFGFTFSYPGNWQPFILRGPRPNIPESLKRKSDEFGSKCGQTELMLLQGWPVLSSIDVLVYPYSCDKINVSGFVQASIDVVKGWGTQNVIPQ